MARTALGLALAPGLRVDHLLLSRREHLDLGTAQLQDVTRGRTGGVIGALLVVLSAFVAVQELRVPVYADMYFQLPEGLQILAGHFPHTVPYGIGAGVWVDHEWLFEAFIAWCWSHGAWAVAIAACDFAYAAFPLLLYALLRRKHDDLAAGTVALLACMGEAYTSPYRPQTFAYYLFVAVLFALRGARPNPLIVFGASVLWANLHASALLAPVLGVLALAGAALEREERARIVRLALCCGAAALGTLVTPHGIGLWTYAATLASRPALAHDILEWTPLSFSQIDAWVVFLPVLAIVALTRDRTRLSGTDALLLIAFGVLAATQRRQIAFLVPATASLLATQLDGLLAVTFGERAIGTLLRRATWSLGAIALVAALVTSIGPLGASRSNFDLLARDETALASGIGAHGNVYAERPVAAYLPFAGFPVRLLIDTHADPYGDEQWNDVVALETVRPGILDVLHRYDLQSVIVLSNQSPAAFMALLPDWRTAARHGAMTAFVRR